MTARRFVRIAPLAGVVLAYRWDRRQSERAVAEDREWAEMQRVIPSTSVDVTSTDGTRLHAEISGRTAPQPSFSCTAGAAPCASGTTS